MKRRGEVTRRQRWADAATRQQEQDAAGLPWGLRGGGLSSQLDFGLLASRAMGISVLSFEHTHNLSQELRVPYHSLLSLHTELVNQICKALTLEFGAVCHPHSRRAKCREEKRLRSEAAFAG